MSPAASAPAPAGRKPGRGRGQGRPQSGRGGDGRYDHEVVHTVRITDRRVRRWSALWRPGCGGPSGRAERRWPAPGGKPFALPPSAARVRNSVMSRRVTSAISQGFLQPEMGSVIERTQDVLVAVLLADGVDDQSAAGGQRPARPGPESKPVVSITASRGWVARLPCRPPRPPPARGRSPSSRRNAPDVHPQIGQRKRRP